MSTIDRLIGLQDAYRSAAAAVMRTSSAVTLVDHLFERPAITVSDAQNVLEVTYAAARKTIDRLIDLFILEEYPGSYPAVFLARGILDAALPSD